METGKHILVVDGNAPWVRALFSPLAGRFHTHTLRVRSGAIGTLTPVSQFYRSHQQADGLFDRTLVVPGWTRFFGASTAIVRRVVQGYLRRHPTDLVVYTLPQYAQVAEDLKGQCKQVYHAHDCFAFYDWDRDRTRALETKMLDACAVSTVVAGALIDDFAALSHTPAVHIPMAVSSSFIEALQQPQALPTDMRLPRPIIGCTGQINDSYNWDLIAAMAGAYPSASFAFVGPVFDEVPEKKSRIDAVLAKPNVHALGAKPHAALPAYLAGFDVCLNPLRVNDHNNRRSPLRLFDYLATDKLILSTAIREASSHAGLIEIFKNTDEAIAMLGNTRAPDLAARRAYIAQNTWQQRAVQFLRACLPDGI